MNNPTEKPKQPDQEHRFEPFPEPKTFPDGWDLSGLYRDEMPVQPKDFDEKPTLLT